MLRTAAVCKAKSENAGDLRMPEFAGRQPGYFLISDLYLIRFGISAAVPSRSLLFFS